MQQDAANILDKEIFKNNSKSYTLVIFKIWYNITTSIKQ